MSRPISIEMKILGRSWLVHPTSEGSKNPLLKSEYGHCDYGMRNIYINTADQDFDECCATLLHEIIHVIDYHSQCGLSEENITRIANGLYSVMSENAADLGWLRKGW
jgi:hypothetical protein